MNILIFTNTFPSQKNPNVGLQVYEQVRRLALVHKVRVILSSPAGLSSYFKTRPRSEIFNGLHLFHCPYLHIPKIGLLLCGDLFLRTVKRCVDQFKGDFSVDCVISHWAYPDGYAAGRIAQQFRVPYIIRPRGSDINLYYRNNVLRQILTKSLRMADHIMPVSKDLMIKVQGLGIDPLKTSFVHGGIDIDKFPLLDRLGCRKKLGLDPDEHIGIFIGNFYPVKGIQTLIPALEQLDLELKEPFRFLFLGKGELEYLLKDAQTRLKNIHLDIVGDIKHHDLHQWINSADFLCLPSYNEGCPNVILESLACGTPVVASAVGGIPEIIDNEDLGILVPAKTPDLLAKAIRSAINKNWDRERLRNRLRNYSWDSVADQINVIINGLMKER